MQFSKKEKKNQQQPKKPQSVCRQNSEFYSKLCGTLLLNSLLRRGKVREGRHKSPVPGDDVVGTQMLLVFSVETGLCVLIGMPRSFGDG